MTKGSTPATTQKKGTPLKKLSAFRKRGGSRAQKLAKEEFEQKKASMKPYPKKWPKDCVVDDRWNSWLPQGWTSAIKMTENNLLLHCYVGPLPERKRFFHKVDVEKYVGRRLTQNERGPKARVVPKQLQKQFAPGSFLERTQAMAKCDYINSRCDKAHGMTIENAVKTLTYADTKGKTVHYNLSDLRYDINGKRLQLVAARPQALSAKLSAKRSRDTARRASSAGGDAPVPKRARPTGLVKLAAPSSEAGAIQYHSETERRKAKRQSAADAAAPEQSSMRPASTARPAARLGSRRSRSAASAGSNGPAAQEPEAVIAKFMPLLKKAGLDLSTMVSVNDLVLREELKEAGVVNPGDRLKLIAAVRRTS